MRVPFILAALSLSILAVPVASADLTSADTTGLCKLIGNTSGMPDLTGWVKPIRDQTTGLTTGVMEWIPYPGLNTGTWIAQGICSLMADIVQCVDGTDACPMGLKSFVPTGLVVDSIAHVSGTVERLVYMP
jgi:hypothetical protein